MKFMYSPPGLNVPVMRGSRTGVPGAPQSLTDTDYFQYTNTHLQGLRSRGGSAICRPARVRHGRRRTDTEQRRRDAGFQNGGDLRRLLSMKC